jgi:4-hydroxy-4-methyl-2-oxoglutarate aldolase
MASRICHELASLGTATVYEASGRQGLIDVELRPLVPGSRACGPARTVRCGQDDNLMVHAVMERVQPGEVLVLTMPEPRPVALIGDMLITQAQARGAVAVLCDAAARDCAELAEMELPVWTRWIRVRGATKQIVGELDVPVEVGGATICPGDLVVLDADGAIHLGPDHAPRVLEASRVREEEERIKRQRLRNGELSIDLYELRALYERPS